MRTKFRKLFVLCIAALLSFSTLAAAGCNSDKNSKQTKINVHYYNGGLGDVWISELEKRFEELFKDTSFEENKVGVDIVIQPDKNFTDLNAAVKAGADKSDIFFTSDTSFYVYHDGEYDVMLDVTDMMNEKVYDNDGNVALNDTKDGFRIQSLSLAERVNDDMLQNYNAGTPEAPQYVAFPYADDLSGIVVDWDFFTEREWNDGTGIDGMPGTIEEFYALLNRIKNGGYYSAFTYAIGHYTRTIEESIILKVDGEEGIKLWETYEGDYDFNGNGQIDADEHITPATAYRLLDTRGYKAVYQFASKLFDKQNGETYYDKNVMDGVTYSDAQNDFLMSKHYEEEGSRPRIAMIFEGDWWENEARGIINSMGRLNAEDGYGKRNFRFMPIPSFNIDNVQDKEEKYTMASHSGGGEVAFINKRIENDPVKLKVCKLWMQYVYSIEGLRTFTVNTGTVLPYKYELTDEQYNSLTPFAKNVYDTHRDERIKVLHYGSSTYSQQVRTAETRVGFNVKTSSGQELKGDVILDTLLAAEHRNITFSWETWLKAAHDFYDSRIEAEFSD